MNRLPVAVHFKQAAKAFLFENAQDQGIIQSFVIQAPDDFGRVSLRRLSASERASGRRQSSAPLRTGGSGKKPFMLSVRSMYMVFSRM